MARRLLVTLITLVVALACSGTPAANADTTNGATAINHSNALNASKQMVLQSLHNDNFSGVWGVFRNDEPVFQATMGYANVENQAPMQFKSVMPIASNTKLFTTVALYQLQEQGKVNLSDPINSYLDQQDFVHFGFPNQTKYCPRVDGQGPCQNITFQQLLGMNSGIPDVIICLLGSETCHLGEFVGNYNGTIAHYVGLFINAPLSFVPGAHFSYSNPNFVLASYLIEKLSGMSLEEYFTKNLFDHVGLRDTYYDPYEGAYHVIENAVSQYMKYYDGKTLQGIATGSCRPSLQMGALSGAGGMVSTVEDMARWYLDLFGDGGASSRVLTAASIKQIVQPWVLIPMDIGLGKYFGQGVTISYANDSAKDWPESITYCGDTLCSFTCIDMKFGKSGNTLITAAFSNRGTMIVDNTTTYDQVQQGSPLVFKVFSGDPRFQYTNINVLQARDALKEIWDSDL